MLITAFYTSPTMGFSGGSGGKESACKAGAPGDPLEKGMATPVLLAGESYGRRSLAGYSSWCHKEWDTTEWLTLLHPCPLLKA